MVKKEKDRHLGLRIEPDLLSKLQYIAKYEDRSINKEVTYLIRREIERFEEEHGKIELDSI